MGLAKIIGIQRHHNLDLGGKHIREYSRERDRQSGKINVTYIEADHNILNCSALSRGRLNRLPTLSLKLV